VNPESRAVHEIIAAQVDPIPNPFDDDGVVNVDNNPGGQHQDAGEIPPAVNHEGDGTIIVYEIVGRSPNPDTRGPSPSPFEADHEYFNFPGSTDLD
jgi:hypothetical protein